MMQAKVIFRTLLLLSVVTIATVLTTVPVAAWPVATIP